MAASLAYLFLEASSCAAFSSSDNVGGRGTKTELYEVTPVIRKLTPKEAERLQTLPDNYSEGKSNTQRYKAI